MLHANSSLKIPHHDFGVIASPAIWPLDLNLFAKSGFQRADAQYFLKASPSGYKESEMHKKTNASENINLPL